MFEYGTPVHAYTSDGRIFGHVTGDLRPAMPYVLVERDETGVEYRVAPDHVEAA